MRLSHRRWIANVAALSLFFSMLAYAAHHHNPRDSAKDDTHCELCLQFHGTAGVPSPLPHTILSLYLVFLAPVVDRGFRGASRCSRVQQPRAPPVLLHS